MEKDKEGQDAQWAKGLLWKTRGRALTHISRVKLGTECLSL